MWALAKTLSRPVRPRFSRLHRAERGASVVEFALVISLLFLLLFGIIQFGIAFNRYQGLQAAGREGARIAAVGGSQKDIQDRVRAAQSLFTATDVQVRIESSSNDGTSWGSPICDDATSTKCTATTGASPCARAGLGNLIRVTVTVPSSLSQYAIVIPLWGNANITYTGRGVFRCEDTV